MEIRTSCGDLILSQALLRPCLQTQQTEVCCLVWYKSSWFVICSVSLLLICKLKLSIFYVNITVYVWGIHLNPALRTPHYYRQLSQSVWNYSTYIFSKITPLNIDATLIWCPYYWESTVLFIGGHIWVSLLLQWFFYIHIVETRPPFRSLYLIIAGHRKSCLHALFHKNWNLFAVLCICLIHSTTELELSVQSPLVSDKLVISWTFCR